MKQRNPWITSIIVAAVGGVVLVCMGLTAVLIMRNNGAEGVQDIARLLTGIHEPPAITIIRPAAPQTLASGEGVMLLAQVQSQDGIQYVEFLVDNVPEKQTAMARSGQVDEEVKFVWFASKAGNHVLSLVAYDNGGQASTPASLAITVEQNRRAFELEAEAQQAAAAEQAGEGKAETPAESGEGEDGEAEEESGGEEVPPEEGPAPEEEAAPEEPAPEEEAEPEEPEPEEEAEPEEPPEPEEAEPEDAVPLVGVFDISTSWMGGDVEGTLHLEATDDQGLMAIVVDVLNDDGESDTLVEFCSDALDCTADFTLAMHNGEWLFGAQAYDNAGQVSTPWVEERQVLSFSGLPPILSIVEVFWGIFPDDGDPMPIDPGFDLMEIIEAILDFDFPMPWLENGGGLPVAALPVEAEWRSVL